MLCHFDVLIARAVGKSTSGGDKQQPSHNNSINTKPSGDVVRLSVLPRGIGNNSTLIHALTGTTSSTAANLSTVARCTVAALTVRLLSQPLSLSHLLATCWTEVVLLQPRLETV